MKDDRWRTDRDCDTAFITIGSNRNAKSERSLHDYYSTNPLAITLLDKYNLLDKNTLYWETACGSGALSKELIKLGYNVVSSDKYNHGYGETGVDFFNCRKTFPGNTITNPPFNQMNEWLQHTLQITENKAYIFGRIQLVESKKRWEAVFKDNPPAFICPFVKRIQCYKNDDLSEKRSPLCYAWFIWDNKSNSKETKVKWLI